MRFFNFKLVILNFIILLVFPVAVSAQKLTLSITPPLIEAVMKPGKSIVIAYTVSNLGDPMIVSANVRPFKPTGIYGDIQLADQLEGPARFNLENSNIQLGEQFLLKSQEGQQLLLKIRLPEGTPEGDYYYTFYVQNDLGRREEGNTAAQAQALIGSNILITVTESGALEVKGSIGQFRLKGDGLLGLPLFESTDVIPVELIVQNTGKHTIKPLGTISLKGNFGERAEFGVLPENVLNTSSRLVHASPSAMLAGTSLALKGFFVGKYTVRAQINFGVGTEADTAEFTFYAVPFKLLIALGAALMVGIVIVKKFRQDVSSD